MRDRAGVMIFAGVESAPHLSSESLERVSISPQQHLFHNCWHDVQKLRPSSGVFVNEGKDCSLLIYGGKARLEGASASSRDWPRVR
jgi:hypothetical protein